MSFDGRVAFVTGGAQGIGYAFANALYERGTSVAIADLDYDAASQAAAQIAKRGDARAIAMQCDVASEVQVEDAVQKTCEQLGGVDILINNAGKHLNKYNQPFSLLPRHELRSLLDVNVVGVVNCSVACLEPMRERGGGSIINIASISSDLLASPYGLSKLAVRALTTALAGEFAPYGIRVNGISPGVVDSEAVLADFTEETLQSVIGRQKIKRQGRVADLVGAMLFLCSDDASFVTGETLRVSGGYPPAL